MKKLKGIRKLLPPSTLSSTIVRKLLQSSAILILLTGSGCSVVYLPAPVGEKPYDISQQKSLIEGSWLGNDSSSLTVQVIDAAAGHIRIGYFETLTTGMEAEIHDVFLTEQDGWLFGNIKAPANNQDDEDAPPKYLWGRFKLDNRTALVWRPDVEKFRDLVESGELPGRIDKGDVYLGSLETGHVARIMSETNGLLFDWTAPTVFIKTSE